MVTMLLNLNMPIVAGSDSDDDKDVGLRASAIASLIAGSPYFNGELKLRGKLISTNVRHNDQFTIEQLNKIKCLDVSNIDTIDSNNFTRYCQNIKQYKGIDTIDLLNSHLNIDNVSFKGCAPIDLDNIYNISNDANVGSWTASYLLKSRLRTALSHGLNYTVNTTKPLTLNQISDDLLQLGFTYTPEHLQITDDKLIGDTEVYSPTLLRRALRYGYTCEYSIPSNAANISSIFDQNQACYLTTQELKNLQIKNVPKTIFLDINNIQEVIRLSNLCDLSEAGDTILDIVKPNKKRLHVSDFVHGYSSVPDDIVLRILAKVFSRCGVKLIKPKATDYKYIKKVYKTYEYFAKRDNKEA